eukprot:CAMPEP_0179460956 /NCGR_PEP_ID=MMETSP0799-20121207/43829_1 /TAXON_ID=46947 /ORGANISM="Geminigera cryophila, Strain CCMP2564" /LENGTH=180 /DNA_ID=CAMNT_0021263371 /DNA_START=66 /DNA_END=603 /DNA_ORIENTATION=+
MIHYMNRTLAHHIKGMNRNVKVGPKGQGRGLSCDLNSLSCSLRALHLCAQLVSALTVIGGVLKLLAAATQPDSAQETASTFLTRSAQNLNSLKKVFSSQANLASPENIISSRGDAFSFPKTTEKTSAERRSGQASSSPEPIAGLRYGGERGVRYEGEVGKRGQLNRAFQPRYFVIQDEAV